MAYFTCLKLTFNEIVEHILTRIFLLNIKFQKTEFQENFPVKKFRVLIVHFSKPRLHDYYTKVF